MYSTFNEGKSVVAERFIKTLKNKIYKHMTSVGKNVCFNVLDNIVKKYSNTFHNSMKMKPPSRQILVHRTSRGRPPPTSPGRPLKVLFDHPGDVPS